VQVSGMIFDCKRL